MGTYRETAGCSDTLYFIGEAQESVSNPIHRQFGLFFVGLVIRPNGEIVDAACSAIMDLTREFVRCLLMGRNLNDVDALCADVEKRYFGASQRTLVVALKDVHKKYRIWYDKENT